MAEDLRGRNALITGGAKRIGRAIGLALAGRGVNIVFNYRKSGPEADETRKADRGTRRPGVGCPGGLDGNGRLRPADGGSTGQPSGKWTSW